LDQPRKRTSRQVRRDQPASPRATAGGHRRRTPQTPPQRPAGALKRRSAAGDYRRPAAPPRANGARPASSASRPASRRIDDARRTPQRPASARAASGQRPRSPRNTPRPVSPQSRKPLPRRGGQLPLGGRRPSRKLPPAKRRPSFFKAHRRGLLAFFLVLIAALGVGYFLLTRTKPLVFASDKYDISSEAAAQARRHRISNVLLLGTDGRNNVDGARSDTIMILSGDFEHSSLKISSILRDSYVAIPGHGYGKLNAAYSYGSAGSATEDQKIKNGAALALKTVNRNFDTAMTDYVVVDFTCVINMVNAVGGVKVDLKSEAERESLNANVADINANVSGHAASGPVAGTGTQKLNGVQALAYARIRHVGNGDFERTQRQRAVLNQVFAKAKKLSLIKQYKLYKAVKPYIHTSMSGREIFKYLFNVALHRGAGIEQQQIPDSSLTAVGMLRGVSYVFPKTLENNIITLHSFIYEEDYTPSDTAAGISAHIQNVWPY
jgi:LCP family protein required for cell wall assembly